MDVLRTLRIRVFSSRRTFNVSFLRFLRGSDLRRVKTFCAERRVQKDLRSSASAWSDVKNCRRRKLKTTLSSSFVVERWVSHSRRWIVTIRVCRERKPAPTRRHTPIVPIAFLVSGGPLASRIQTSYRKRVILPFSACFTVYGKYRIFRLHFSDLTDKVLTK